MNMMGSFQGPASGRIRDPIITIINKLGLRDSLQLCLDAGDDASYSGSGQTWSDRSGNGTDFLRGATSSSEASDPTFNGTAGRNTINEYWSFDGADYFTLSGANPTWVNDFQKNNAVSTFVSMVYINTSVSYQNFAGDIGTVGAAWSFGVNPDNTVYSAIYDDAFALQIANTSTTATMSEDAWHFVAAAIDEGANSHITKVDSTNNISTDSGTPGTGDTNGKMNIGRGGSGVTDQLIESGGRMNFFLVWNRKMSTTELDNFYRYIQSKYGV